MVIYIFIDVITTAQTCNNQICKGLSFRFSFQGQFKKNLEEHCDRALYSIIQLLKSEIIIAIGSYAEQRVLSCLRNNNPLGTRVVRLPHPSPMAKNNQNWVDKAPGVLRDIGVIQYFTK